MFLSKRSLSLPLLEAADWNCINLVMRSDVQCTYSFSHLDKLLGCNAGGWTPLVIVGHWPRPDQLIRLTQIFITIHRN